MQLFTENQTFHRLVVMFLHRELRLQILYKISI